MKSRYPFQMPDDNRDDAPDARNLRAQAAVLIAQARGQVTDIQRALGSAPAGSALQSRLATTAAQASAAIAALTQSLSNPGATLHQSDLMALEGVVFSGDAAALVAEAAAHAGSAGAAQAVAAASAATRQEVQTAAHDIFDRKIFDPYLRIPVIMNGQTVRS